MSSHFNGKRSACAAIGESLGAPASRPQGLIESPPSAGKRAFEPGTWAPDGGFVFATNPPSGDLRKSYDIAVCEIGPDVAPLPVVHAVYAHNRLAWWAIHRSRDETRVDASLEGLCALLPLNEVGLVALKTGELDPRDPDLRCLAPEGEAPAALYLWAIVAHGLSDLAGKLIAHGIGLDIYERIPMFGRIGTQAGLDALRRSSKMAPGTELRIGAPFEIRLSRKHLEDQRAMRIFEGRRVAKPAPRYETLVASTPDHIARVFAIRAAVFMTEQNCPYEEEYDGNDYTGTHILGLANGEPAAVLRIRYFADFVKIERLAVLGRFRGSRISHMVVQHALALVRRKGYRTAYGHAQKRVAPFWSRFGFRPMAKNTGLVFSDHEYVEMVAPLEPHEDSLTIHSDPYMLIRPEGRWDEVGVLERSAARAATNPR